MPPQFWAPSERAALCDLLDELGPDAPTLCTGWTSGDLAAHLVVREYSLMGAVGIMVPVFAPATIAAMRRVLQRPFPAIVDRIRRGGVLPREGRIAEALHLLEFAVHHQDIVRASDLLVRPHGGGADEAREAAVFEQLRRRSARLGRHIPAGVGVLLRSQHHGSIEMRRGPLVMVVDGAPVDLALWLFGRIGASMVTIEHDAGDGDIRSRVEASLSR